MKGTIIAIVLSFIVLWSLNHRVLSTFFKIKRQRLYKPNNFYETNSKMENVSSISSIASVRKKRLKETKTRPPLK